MKQLTLMITVILLSIFTVSTVTATELSETNQTTETVFEDTHPTTYNTVEVNGVDIFYREAGRKDAPTILLLHGYPTSSYMYRNLIEDLSDDFHLLAPDYPGYGRSEQPAMADFDYTFDNMANIIEGFLDAMSIDKFSMYVMDYGAPVGYRVFAKYPERVEAIIVQNGNAYEEGLGAPFDALRANWANNNDETRSALEGFHTIDGLKWQYTTGVNDASLISPDNWHVDLQHISRPENNEIQLAMFYDYRTNIALYPEWHAKLREHQPPMLIVWGKNDPIFPESGAHPYLDDVKDAEIHILDTGHFALEDKGDEIARYIQNFFSKNMLK